MHAVPHQGPQGSTPGPNFPSTIEQPGAGTVRQCVLMVRVGRVLQDLSAARELSDQEIRQHAADCTSLMEAAYQRFEAHGDPADREAAVLWMHRRDEANRCLSPGWKAAREAQVLRAAEGCGFFMEQGDAARARLAGGRG